MMLQNSLNTILDNKSETYTQKKLNPIQRDLKACVVPNKLCLQVDVGLVEIIETIFIST